MISSLVFSVCIKVCKNLQFNIMSDFWPNKLLLENAQILCLKGTTEFLRGIGMKAQNEQERSWVSEWLILKSYLFMHIEKTYLPHFLFQFNSGSLENVQIPSSKPYITSYVCSLTDTTFGAEISTFEKFQFHK